MPLIVPLLEMVDETPSIPHDFLADDISSRSFIPSRMIGAVRGSVVLNLLTQCVRFSSPLSKSGQVKVPFSKVKVRYI